MRLHAKILFTDTTQSASCAENIARRYFTPIETLGAPVSVPTQQLLGNESNVLLTRFSGILADNTNGSSDSGNNSSTNDAAALSARDQLCVLKMLDIEAMEQNYTACTNSRSALQYSCWMEIQMLLSVRKLLLRRATPCFAYMYNFFIIEPPRTPAPRSPVYLTICCEFLSRITLGKWLEQHIVNCRHFHHISNQIRLKTRAKTHQHLMGQFQTLFLHIFVALLCLHDETKSNHHDLHLSNILMVQSRESAKHFAYILGDGSGPQRCYVVPNNLGEALQQLPVICDFGVAADGTAAQNTNYAQQYRTTMFCAFHTSKDGVKSGAKCKQAFFCDVLRLLNAVHQHLQRYGDRVASHRRRAQQMAIVMSAFTPFDLLRRHLNDCKRTSCLNCKFDNLADLIDQVFAPLLVSRELEQQCKNDAKLGQPNNSVAYYYCERQQEAKPW